MTTSTLLDIDVDSLFEQCSISEIDLVHKKLQQNIEAKKEELRIMVGERYRDLLQAADTIGEMRKTSSNVIEHIHGIIGSCRNLNEHQLIGFKIDTNAERGMETVQKNYYGCMAQIHLLTKLPELIWSHLDECDYFVATQLFIFARHISTGLQLDTNIMRKYPVVKRQWNHLNQFFFMIKQMCLDELERPELTTDTAVKCLTSLVLLENCQLDKLLTMFIQLRARAFRRMLTTISDENNAKPHQSAKRRIIDSLQLLNETVLQVFKCFIDSSGSESGADNKCLLARELELITGPNAQPVIHMLQMNESLMNDTLPSLISKFKPQMQMQPIDSDAVRRSLDTWLQTTENDSKQLLKTVIGNISSVRTIHNVNKAVSELEIPSNWPLILQSLQLSSNIDFYHKFYQPMMQDRIKAIITTSWTTAVEHTEKKICEVFESNVPSLIDENSFWDENSEDSPKSLKQALDMNRQNHRLLMKTKGYSPELCTICNELDKSVESIYNDLRLYVSSLGVDSIELREDPIVRKEQSHLVEFLKSCSQNGISDLISKIKLLGVANNERAYSIVFLAKLLKAITEICPNVKQCLMPTSLLLSNTWNESSNVSHMERFEHWERICRLLNEESVNLWKQWIDLFIGDNLRKHNGLCFRINIDLINLLDFFPNWETYTIEGKDDESNSSVQSTIRVPAHPSIPLQKFLIDCCTKLNEKVAETLPKAVTSILTDRLLNRIVHTYVELSNRNEFVFTNQNACLQFYFDLKFLTILFLNGKWNDQLQSLAGKFKSRIDPFDLELLHGKLHTNVKLSAQRKHQQYGLLIPSTSTNQSLLAAVTKTSGANLTQEKDPNLLSLANNGVAHSNWFTMLPIVVSTKTSATLSEPVENKAPTTQIKSEKRKSPSKSSGTTPQSSAQQNLANVKSNAAAFFGAMSQDWFR
ncbi:conserved oligomeric Golgi complex subunit 1 [Contarinia nasturtii]|uniref:conserved oligomeric Golgi complex subunit 1 n=1 Tax=Contarinia nasturtii TaxID=265458 RepID=UPI0012D41F10|nr:conserved oligomeric Golgi complex subunit 1 [Contarinia nasturtii]